MQIAFQLPHVFYRGSSPDENADVLRSLLECLIAVDRAYLKYHPGTPPLYSPAAGVRYVRTVDWLTTPALYFQGYGDCKSLTATRIAELRHRGKVAQPSFRFMEKRGGGTLYHILVQTGVDSFEDPSKICGMPDSEIAPFFQKG